LAENLTVVSVFVLLFVSLITQQEGPLSTPAYQQRIESNSLHQYE